MEFEKLNEYVEAIVHAVQNSAHPDVAIRGLVEGAYIDGYADGFHAGHTMGITGVER